MTDLMTREVRTADVSYNGTVRVSHRSLVTLPCVFNVQSFPYDYQVSLRLVIISEVLNYSS